MAQCIPDRLPRQASQGEVRLFNIWAKLPVDCLIYYEPVVENRYPIAFMCKTGTVRVLFGWLKKKKYPALAHCLSEMNRLHELRW